MSEVDNLESLKKRLAAIPGLTEEELNILTSQEILTHIMPLMTAFTTETVTQTQKVKDLTGEAMRTLAEKVIIAPSGPGDINRFVKDISDGIFNADWIEKEINTWSDHWLFGPIMAMVIGGIHIGTTAVNYLSVSSERTKQIANRDIRPFLLDLASLTEEWFRNPNNYKWVRDQMEKMGVSDDKIEIFFKNQINLLPLEALRILWNREEIDTEELHTRMRKLRINPDDFQHFETVMKQYPSVSDFVLFAIREAFDEQFVSDAGLGSDMPEEFIDEVQKAGLPEKYARQFWYAHWKPPAVGQVFDMLHRGIIDMEEVNTLLRINDIMPNYREKLTKIAYNVVGRVDIRRLYQDGVIEYEKMYDMYLDQGQSPENAELLADWTDIHYGEDRRQRTRTDIIKLYRLGTYGRTQAIAEIQNIGYPEDIATEYVTRSDLEQAEKRKNGKLKVWRKGLINFVFTEAEVRQFMTLIGMKKPEIDELLIEWKVDKDSKIKFLPLPVIGQMYSNNIMNDDDVDQELSIQGYTSNDIDRLIQLWRA